MKQFITNINCMDNAPVFLVTINEVGYIVAFSDKYESLCPCCMYEFERSKIVKAVKEAHFKERIFWVSYENYAYAGMDAPERFIHWIEEQQPQQFAGCEGLFKLGVLSDLPELKAELGLL